MKKHFFSFVMMLVLVIVAGKAMAQTNTTPFIGSKYTYKLNGVVVPVSGTATVSYSDATHVTLSKTTFPVTAGTTTYSFDITFNDGAIDGKLTVNVKDVAGCENFIELAVKPKAKPALALKIEGNVPDLCQKTKTGTLTDNTDAVTDGGTSNTNSFTFTVTPAVSNVSANYTYAYSIVITDVPGLTGYNVAYTGTGSYSGGVVSKGVDMTPDVFTVTFKTTTDIAPQVITGALDNAVLTVTTTSGTGTYNATFGVSDVDKSDVVTVKSMPTIGQFTIE